MKKPATCLGCPAYLAGRGLFVPPTTVENPKIVFVGSGPGSDEALDGAPFTGFTGRKFDFLLAKAGLRRDNASIGHIVQCQMPYKKGKPRDPTPKEVEFCRRAHWGSWYEQQIANVPVVVPVGTMAMKTLVSKKLKARDVGNVYPDGPGRVFLPIQSPTFLMGNPTWEPAQISYLKYVRDILREGIPTNLPDFTKFPPGIKFIDKPSLSDLTEFAEGLSYCTVDIESAGDHLRLVGFYDTTKRIYLGFPVRTSGGGNYWSDSDLPRAIEWLYDILSNSSISKTFHNGPSFDIPVLERNGFRVEGVDFDTMLAMHVAHVGVPKGLEELAKVFLRRGGWKALVKEEEDEEGMDK